MTIGNATGTILVAPRWSAGAEYTAIGSYTFAAEVANGDTITWADLIPKGAEVVDVTYYGVELDTDASPTGTINIGDGTDVDGFIDGASIGLAAAGANQVIAKSNGEKLGTTYTTATDVKLTVASAVATAASSGNVYVAVRYNCVGVAQVDYGSDFATDEDTYCY